MTDFEKLPATLREIGIPFELTDDSEEYPYKEVERITKEGKSVPDTVIQIDCSVTNSSVYFFFTKEGKYKYIDTYEGCDLEHDDPEDDY